MEDVKSLNKRLNKKKRYVKSKKVACTVMFGGIRTQIKIDIAK